MRTSGRLGGALLGAGLPNAGAIMGGIGNATGGLAGGGARVAGSISNSSRSLVKGASSWNPKLASWNPKSGSWRPTGRPRGMNDGLAPLRLLGEASNNLISRTVSAGFTAVEKANDFLNGGMLELPGKFFAYANRGYLQVAPMLLSGGRAIGEASNNLISRTVSAGFTAVEKANDFLNGGMLELPGKFFAYANRGDLQVAPMLSLGGRASRVAKKPVRDGFLKKRLDPSPQGLRPGKRSFKTELGFGAAGLFASVPIVIGMESQMPSNKVSAEGNITGIGSSPRGGISPELQMSTQGLTLGIHNKRKSRLM